MNRGSQRPGGPGSCSPELALWRAAHRAARSAALLGLVCVLLAACGPNPSACPPQPSLDEAHAAVSLAAEAKPAQVEINGSPVWVDRVVRGPLCNGDWRGTVYVACDVQVPAWAETPTFLERCDLTIAPGSVVYVAYHNDTAYYNGCSCHTGEIGLP